MDFNGLKQTFRKPSYITHEEHSEMMLIGAINSMIKNGQNVNPKDMVRLIKMAIKAYDEVKEESSENKGVSMH